MKKVKIMIRLIMIIFMFSLPVYQFFTLKEKYLEERRIDLERQEKLTQEIREGFLVRRENFYEDSLYKREFEKLQKQ